MSGIYIPGMEMPTGTDVLTIAIDSHGKLYSIYVSDGELGINPLHKSVIPVPDRKVLTNADSIRAMTDEGIEDWYWWMHKEMMRYTDSRVFVHDWLKSPAGDGDY